MIAVQKGTIAAVTVYVKCSTEASAPLVPSCILVFSGVSVSFVSLIGLFVSFRILICLSC